MFVLKKKFYFILNVIINNNLFKFEINSSIKIIYNKFFKYYFTIDLIKFDKSINKIDKSEIFLIHEDKVLEKWQILDINIKKYNNYFEFQFSDAKFIALI